MNCCSIPFNVCYFLLLMVFLMFPSRLGRLFLDGTVSLLPACVGSTPRVGDYCVLLRLESPGKTHLFVLQQGDILVLYQAVKSWDTAYLGGVLLDAAITAVEAVYFLATPLFLFLPWILYDVIVKWFGLSAVIFGGDLGF